MNSPLNPDIRKYLEETERNEVSPSPNPIRITKEMIEAARLNES